MLIKIWEMEQREQTFVNVLWNQKFYMLKQISDW